jgi:hypothetical protein
VINSFICPPNILLIIRIGVKLTGPIVWDSISAIFLTKYMAGDADYAFCPRDCLKFSVTEITSVKPR